MATQTYSPKDVNISILGQNISGWESFTISRANPNTTQQVSADGDFVGITYSSNKTGTVEITVQQQNSLANVFLAALQTAQDEVSQPIPTPITVADKSGGVLVQITGAFLDMPANMDLAAEQSDRVWGFFASNITYVPNPNNIFGDDFATAINAVTTAKEALQ